MEPFFQVGIIVQDIEASMKELTDAQGVQWGEVANRKITTAEDLAVAAAVLDRV